jgi:small conductance mechanosensitive channel
MKIFIKSLIVVIAYISTAWNTYAAVSGNEAETANSFVDGLTTIISADMLLKLISALLIVVITFLIAKIVRNKVFVYLEGKLWGEWANKQEMLFMTSRVVNITIIITWITVALGILWVDMTIFMGWIWFGIGFTLRTFLSNFIAWIIMVSQWTYHTHDLIEVEWKQWRILRINTLFTTAQQLDGVIFTIPNISFLDKEVKNYNASEKRRIDIDIHFDYDADIIKIKSVLKKVALSFDEVLTSPEAKMVIESFDDSYIRVQYRPWILSDSNFITMKSNLLETINLAFKQAGIDVAKQKITMLSE